ncbi:MAG: hypothetical protein JNM85_03650 [Chthonomonas sp.]|nr:hypothetical protein [Chthonomonas sp.]
MKWIGALLLTLVLVLAGCGGGGGGGGTTSFVNLTGVVTYLSTGAPPSPQATIQAGSRSTKSNASDGSFVMSAASGTSSIVILFQVPGGGTQTMTYTFAPATGDLDLGELFVAPETVTVTGKALAAADSAPVPGATVRFAGRSTTTDSSGTYTLTDVAFDSTALAAFLSLEGTVIKSGFFPATLSANAGPSSGVVTIDDIFLSADIGVEPPGTPSTVDGTVTPGVVGGTGTVVQLVHSGTVIRSVTVGSNGKFGFWVPVGSYILRASNSASGKSSGDVTVVLTSPTDVVRPTLTLQ